MPKERAEPAVGTRPSILQTNSRLHMKLEVEAHVVFSNWRGIQLWSPFSVGLRATSTGWWRSCLLSGWFHRILRSVEFLTIEDSPAWVGSPTKAEKISHDLLQRSLSTISCSRAHVVLFIRTKHPNFGDGTILSPVKGSLRTGLWARTQHCNGSFNCGASGPDVSLVQQEYMRYNMVTRYESRFSEIRC